MVRIADINPQSLTTLTPEDLADSVPVSPPAPPTPPVLSTTITAADLQESLPEPSPALPSPASPPSPPYVPSPSTSSPPTLPPVSTVISAADLASSSPFTSPPPSPTPTPAADNPTFTPPAAPASPASPANVVSAADLEASTPVDPTLASSRTIHGGAADPDLDRKLFLEWSRWRDANPHAAQLSAADLHARIATMTPDQKVRHFANFLGANIKQENQDLTEDVTRGPFDGAGRYATPQGQQILRQSAASMAPELSANEARVAAANSDFERFVDPIRAAISPGDTSIEQRAIADAARAQHPIATTIGGIEGQTTEPVTLLSTSATGGLANPVETQAARLLVARGFSEAAASAIARTAVGAATNAGINVGMTAEDTLAREGRLPTGEEAGHAAAIGAAAGPVGEVAGAAARTIPGAKQLIAAAERGAPRTSAVAAGLLKNVAGMVGTNAIATQAEGGEYGLPELTRDIAAGITAHVASGGVVHDFENAPSPAAPKAAEHAPPAEGAVSPEPAVEPDLERTIGQLARQNPNLTGSELEAVARQRVDKASAQKSRENIPNPDSGVTPPAAESKPEASAAEPPKQTPQLDASARSDKTEVPNAESPPQPPQGVEQAAPLPRPESPADVPPRSDQGNRETAPADEGAGIPVASPAPASRREQLEGMPYNWLRRLAQGYRIDTRTAGSRELTDRILDFEGRRDGPAVGTNTPPRGTTPPVLGTKGGISETPPPSVVPAPTRQTADLANLPDYAREEIDRRFEDVEASGKRAGVDVVGRIEASAAGRNTATQTAKELADLLPGKTPAEKREAVRAVRAKLGIPSLDDRTEFDSWIKSRSKAPATKPLPAAPAARYGEPSEVTANEPNQQQQQPAPGGPGANPGGEGRLAGGAGATDVRGDQARDLAQRAATAVHAAVEQHILAPGFRFDDTPDKDGLTSLVDDTSGRRIRVQFRDSIPEHVSPDRYVESITGNHGGKVLDFAGEKVKVPRTPAEWAKLTPAEQERIQSKFVRAAAYNRSQDAIVMTPHSVDRAERWAEEVFHAGMAALEKDDPKAFRDVLNKYGTEDAAFRKGYLKLKARARNPDQVTQSLMAIRAGEIWKPPPTSAKPQPPRQAYTSIHRSWFGRDLFSFQPGVYTLRKGEAATRDTGRGGRTMPVQWADELTQVDKYARSLVDKIRELTPEVWKVRGSQGEFFLAPPRAVEIAKELVPNWRDDVAAGQKRLQEYRAKRAATSQAKANEFEEEAQWVAHDQGIPIEEARQLLYESRETEKNERDLNERFGPAPDEEDLPFATERKNANQLTIPGEVEGRATAGDTGKLFDEEQGARRPPRPFVMRKPEGVDKFGLEPHDLRVADAFSDREASPAFAYGVKQALLGKALPAVKGMTTAEAKEAMAGHRAAHAGMSDIQREHAETPAPPADHGETLFSTEPAPEDEPPGVGREDLEREVHPRLLHAIATSAAAKTLHAADHELFDAPPSASEVPLRVSGKAMGEALADAGKDWGLDAAAMEKYREPAIKAARKLLALARKQGSFDAALAFAESPPESVLSTKQIIKRSTDSRDPDKIILSAKDALRQAMRQREQGRSEGLREAVKLRQKYLEAAGKYLPREERGMLLGDIARISDENSLHARLQKLYQAFERVEKRRAVDDVRDLIRGADTKHLRPEFKAAMEELTGDLDNTTPSDRTRKRAEGLQAFLRTNPDAEAQLPKRAHELIARMSKEPLESFSMDELKELGDSIRGIVAQNSLKNKLIVGKHLRDLAKAERTAVHEVIRSTKPLGIVERPGGRTEMADKGMLGKLLEYTDSPEVLAIGAGGEGGVLHEHLYESLRKGENVTTGMMRKYRTEIQDLIAKHKLAPADIIKWRDAARTVKLSDLAEVPATRGPRGSIDQLSDTEKSMREMGDVLGGVNEPLEPNVRKYDTFIPTGPAEENVAAPATGRQIELTGPEALAAWLYDQNPDAREKLLNNPINVERFAGQSARNRTLTEGDLIRIGKTLTPFERELGELILRQNQEMGDEIGKIHVALKGYELAKQENYFPLITDQKQKRRVLDELSSVYADKWLEQSGFLKERVKHKVPVLLSDALDTHLWHLRQATSFTGKAIPVRNARLLLGSPKVRETLDSHAGKAWTPRMEKMLKDFSGAELGARTDGERLAAALARNAAAATLGLRPTTVATNFLGAPLDMLTQLAPDERRAFLKKFVNFQATLLQGGKYFQEHIAPHSPYLADRYDIHGGVHRTVAIGGDDAGGAGGGIPTAKTAAGQKFREFQEWSLRGMEKAERASAIAAHQALADVHPEWTDAQVADHVEKIVRRTQNARSSLDMSEFHRQTKAQPLFGLAFMFTSQAAKQRDILRLAAMRFQRSAKTPADYARLGSTAALVASSAALVPAIVRNLWHQAKGGFQDDEKKSKSVAEHVAGAVADLGDVVHPIVGDLVRLTTSKQGAPDTLNSRALGQIAGAVQSIYQEGQKLAEPESRRRRNLLPAVYRVIANLSRGISTFAGVPLDAPLSLGEGVYKAAAGKDPEAPLQQELRDLRARTFPNAADPQERWGDLRPLERARLKALERLTESIHTIRNNPKIPTDQADRLVQQLVDAAAQQQRQLDRFKVGR